MFANLKNTVFNKPNIIDQSVNAQTINQTIYSGNGGIEILRGHISVQASHDANTVTKAGCSPETRTRILNELEDWMDDDDPKIKLVWLYGPAGAGKSAIAQTTMQRAEERGHLSASFFFSRGAEGRNNADRLFPTISYQLTRKNPGLAQSVDGILSENPEIPFKSLDIQFRALISRPLQECTRNTTALHPLVGIDGVDECDNELAQVKFLTIIGDSVRSQSPFRFLISSRPEPHIRDFFKKIGLPMREIVLETSAESLDDILTYLRAGFADIRETHSHFMKGIPPLQPWPSEDDLMELRWRSSGHFIYAATVLKFVGNSSHLNPIRQLDIILRQPPEMTPALRASPYPELDRLYHQVLSGHPNPSRLQQILMFFFVEGVPPYPDLLDDLLNLDQGTVIGSLSSMHSLIKTTPLDTAKHPSVFHHASFRDFLLDSSRSQGFHVDKNKSTEKVISICMDFLIQCIREATQDELHDCAKVPQVPGTCFSKRQCSVVQLCRSLSFRRHDAIRLIRAIPSLPVVPSKSMIFILNQFRSDQFRIDASHPPNIPTILFYWSSIPHHRRPMIYKAFLEDKNSSNFHFILKPPYIFALHVPVTVLTLIHGIDPSAFTKEFYHLLNLDMKADFYLREYIWGTSPFKQYLDDRQQEKKSLIALTGKCLQFLTSEQDWGKCEAIATSLTKFPMEKYLRENIDNLVLFLADAKTRSLKSQEEHSIASYVVSMLEKVMYWSSNYRNTYQATVAQVSKELLYLTNDSPCLIKFHSCFLGPQRTDLKGYPIPDEVDLLPALRTDSEFPLLSTDFQFFNSNFRYSILWFLMDREHAGGFYIPMNIMCRDLNIQLSDLHKH